MPSTHGTSSHDDDVINAFNKSHSYSTHRTRSRNISIKKRTLSIQPLLPYNSHVHMAPAELPSQPFSPLYSTLPQSKTNSLSQTPLSSNVLVPKWVNNLEMRDTTNPLYNFGKSVDGGLGFGHEQDKMQNEFENQLTYNDLIGTLKIEDDARVKKMKRVHMHYHRSSHHRNRIDVDNSEKSKTQAKPNVDDVMKELQLTQKYMTLKTSITNASANNKSSKTLKGNKHQEHEQGKLDKLQTKLVETVSNRLKYRSKSKVSNDNGTGSGKEFIAVGFKTSSSDNYGSGNFNVFGKEGGDGYDLSDSDGESSCSSSSSDDDHNIGRAGRGDDGGGHISEFYDIHEESGTSDDEPEEIVSSASSSSSAASSADEGEADNGDNSTPTTLQTSLHTKIKKRVRILKKERIIKEKQIYDTEHVVFRTTTAGTSPDALIKKKKIILIKRSEDCMKAEIDEVNKKRREKKYRLLYEKSVAKLTTLRMLNPQRGVKILPTVDSDDEPDDDSDGNSSTASRESQKYPKITRTTIPNLIKTRTKPLPSNRNLKALKIANKKAGALVSNRRGSGVSIAEFDKKGKRISAGSSMPPIISPKLNDRRTSVTAVNRSPSPSSSPTSNLVPVPAYVPRKPVHSTVQGSIDIQNLHTTQLDNANIQSILHILSGCKNKSCSSSSSHSIDGGGSGSGSGAGLCATCQKVISRNLSVHLSEEWGGRKEKIVKYIQKYTDSGMNHVAGSYQETELFGNAGDGAEVNINTDPSNTKNVYGAIYVSNIISNLNESCSLQTSKLDRLERNFKRNEMRFNLQFGEDVKESSVDLNFQWGGVEMFNDSVKRMGNGGQFNSSPKKVDVNDHYGGHRYDYENDNDGSDNEGVVDPYFEDNVITSMVNNNGSSDLFIPLDMQRPWSSGKWGKKSDHEEERRRRNLAQYKSQKGLNVG